MRNFFYIIRAIESCVLPCQLETCRKLISLYKGPGPELLNERWCDKLSRLENYDLRKTPF